MSNYSVIITKDFQFVIINCQSDIKQKKNYWCNVLANWVDRLTPCNIMNYLDHKSKYHTKIINDEKYIKSISGIQYRLRVIDILKLELEIMQFNSMYKM